MSPHSAAACNPGSEIQLSKDLLGSQLIPMNDQPAKWPGLQLFKQSHRTLPGLEKSVFKTQRPPEG